MIILDDPFSGLDKGECEHLLSVLNYLHEINHTTRVISGQDYTLLSRLASKYGVMAVSYTHLDVYKRQAAG